MREIIFRGYDAIGEKGWVYGDLVHNQKVTIDGLKPRIMVGGYEVVPDTIGQYTGLLDKNGREIYEGDVVEFRKTDMDSIERDHVAKVFFKDGAFNISSYKKYHLEVIGNVFDDKKNF